MLQSTGLFDQKTVLVANGECSHRNDKFRLQHWIINKLCARTSISISIGIRNYHETMCAAYSLPIRPVRSANTSVAIALA